MSSTSQGDKTAPSVDESAVDHASSPLAKRLRDKSITEGRRKFSNHLEEQVLDYLHNNPANIEACLNTIIKLFSNIINHPAEDKFRKVKATNNTLRSTVLKVKGGEDLLLHGGFVPRVIELEKHWVFDAELDGVRFEVLREALHLTEKALQTVHEKAEKKRREREEKLTKESAEKERIRLAIEEDREERKRRAEMMAAAASAAAYAGEAQGTAAPSSPHGGTTASRIVRPTSGTTPMQAK